ncbi:unnamed protein product, partial [Discosporangium mesarthrocarpum]
LTNGDLLRPLQLDVWDFNKNGKHDWIGVAKTTIRGLLQGIGTTLVL